MTSITHCSMRLRESVRSLTVRNPPPLLSLKLYQNKQSWKQVLPSF